MFCFDFARVVGKGRYWDMCKFLYYVNFLSAKYTQSIRRGGSLKIQNRDFIRSLESRCQADAKPMPSRCQADTKPMPSRYQADTKPMPSRCQADTKPMPSRCQADAKPMPSRYQTLYYTLPFPTSRISLTKFLQSLRKVDAENSISLSKPTPA